MDPAEQGPRPRLQATCAKPVLEQSRTWALAWVVWFITLCILSSMTHPGPKIDVIGFDKIEHAVYFAIGGTLLLLAVTLRVKNARAALMETRWLRLAFPIFLAGAMVGWLDEWHQSFTPGRSGLDVYDWLADVTGSLAALPLARFVLRGLAARAERACRVSSGTP